MTRDELRKALLEDTFLPKEILTNDGRVIRVKDRERWALGTDVLFVLQDEAMNLISIRNIASVRMLHHPRRSRRRAN